MLNLAGRRNSPDRSTKSTPSDSRGPSTVCKRRVSGSLSLPSRGSFHLSLTVLCSIGHQVVFSLTGWSPRVPTRFLVSRGTLDPTAPPLPSPTGLSPSLAGLPRPFRWDWRSRLSSEPRSARAPVWAPSVSLAATPEIILYFLFLRLLRCFSSPGSLPHVMDSREDDRSLSGRVSPFRNPRISAHLRLPAAYRSLSRLSSALGAKASALRP